MPKASSTRHIPSVPEKILDAPDLLNDYCQYGGEGEVVVGGRGWCWWCHVFDWYIFLSFFLYLFLIILFYCVILFYFIYLFIFFFWVGMGTGCTRSLILIGLFCFYCVLLLIMFIFFSFNYFSSSQLSFYFPLALFLSILSKSYPIPNYPSFNPFHLLPFIYPPPHCTTLPHTSSTSSSTRPAFIGLEHQQPPCCSIGQLRVHLECWKRLHHGTHAAGRPGLCVFTGMDQGRWALNVYQ